MRVSLRESNKGSCCIWISDRDGSSSCSNITSESQHSSSRGNVRLTDVLELGEISLSSGIEGPPFESVEVSVHPSSQGVVGHRTSKVPGQHESVDLCKHVTPVGVLVQKASTEDGVLTHSPSGHTLRYLTESGVVRVLGSMRGILNSKEVSLNTMREAYIIANVDTHSSWGERLVLKFLILGKNDVTGTLTHLNSLVVVNNSVHSPHLNVLESGCGVIGTSNEHISDSSGSTHTTSTGIDDEKIRERSKLEIKMNLVEWKSTRWNSGTGIQEEGNGERKQVCGSYTELESSIITRLNLRSNRSGHGSDLTDHVVVTDDLAALDVELPEVVEPEALDLVDFELVEGDGTLLDEIVHETICPANGRIGSKVSTRSCSI